MDYMRFFMMIDEDVACARKCPYCSKAPDYVDSEQVYGQSYGMIYLCVPCDAWVGVHKDGKPLGRLADRKLRKAKKEAHRYFDGLWKKKVMLGMRQLRGRGNYPKWVRKCRADGYKWLAEELQIPEKYCHVGMFDLDLCSRVVEICKSYYR